MTPPSFQPRLQSLDGSVQFTGQPGTQAPPGAESIGITLSGVVLEGGFPELAAQNAALEARLTRGRIPVSELFDATAELEAAYAEAGFVLARVVLPQQSLRDGGVLQITVVDGFVEDVETDAVPEPIRARIVELTDPLVGQRRLTLGQLERQLLLAGDVPGLALDSALAAGSAPGGVIVALDSEFRPVTGFAAIDNAAPGSLGNYTINAGVEVNSPFGFGELFYGRIAANPDSAFTEEPRYRALAAGTLVPFGPSGFSLALEVSSTATTPEGGANDTTSRFDRLALRAFYPILRSRTANVSAEAVLDLQRDTQDLLTPAGRVAVYEDRLSVLRLSVDGAYLFENGSVLSGGVLLSRGIDAFGARRQGDVGAGGTPLSQATGDSVFSKLNADFAYAYPVAETVTLSLAGALQSSFGDRLLVSERFSIDGPGAISAFESGTVRGDSGWFLRAEIAHTEDLMAGQSPIRLTPYAFAARGEIVNENATVLEPSHETATSIGIGVELLQRINDFEALSGRFEYAVGERSNGKDGSSFGVTISRRF